MDGKSYKNTCYAYWNFTADLADGGSVNNKDKWHLAINHLR